jgi:flagellar assembly protein FliH
MSSSTDHVMARRFAPLGQVSRPSVAEERSAAVAAGYAEGWATGRQQAMVAAEAEAEQRAAEHAALQAALRQRCDSAVAALAHAADQLHQRQLPVLDEMGETLLEAALSLASAVLDRELQGLDDTALLALRRTVAPLPGDGPVRVRLNPADHVELTQHGDRPAWNGRELDLAPDASLRRGEAVAEADGALVDGRIASALDRARTALAGPRSTGVIEVSA